MNIHRCRQGSGMWAALKAGKPSASCFHRILTAKKLCLSRSSEAYAAELLAEWLLGAPLNNIESPFMARGTDIEKEAREWYADYCGERVDEVGFVTTDDGRIGCSPDGLVGDEGGVEIKCLGPAKHVSFLLHPRTEDYAMQCYGGMMIAERRWWDLVVYHPTIRPVVVRVHRDDAVIEAISSAVSRFADDLDAKKEALIRAGHRPRDPMIVAGFFCRAVRNGRWCRSTKGLAENEFGALVCEECRAARDDRARIDGEVSYA